MSQSISRRNFLIYGSSLVALGSFGTASEVAASSKKYGGRRRLELNVCCNANSIRFTGPMGPNPDDSINDPGPLHTMVPLSSCRVSSIPTIFLTEWRERWVGSRWKASCARGGDRYLDQ